MDHPSSMLDWSFKFPDQRIQISSSKLPMNTSPTVITDGSTLGYGTDYPHLKRKVHITHTSAHHPITYIASRYIVSLVLIL